MSKNNDILDVLKSHSDQRWEGDLSAQWDAVNTRLNRRRAILAWWWVPLAGMLLLGSVLLYQYSKDDSGKEEATLSLVDKDTQASEGNSRPEKMETGNKGHKEQQVIAPETPAVGSMDQPAEREVVKDAIEKKRESSLFPKTEGESTDIEWSPMLSKAINGFHFKGFHSLPFQIITDRPDKPVRKEWRYEAKPEIGLMTSPGWMLRELSANNSLLNRSFLNKIDGKVNASLGYQLGVQVRLPIADRWVISTGIGATTMSESVQFNHRIDSFPVVDGDKIVDYAPLAPIAQEQVSHSGINQYQYLSIPLAVQYRMPLGKQGWVLSPEVGASFWLTPSQRGFEIDPTYLNLIDLNQNLITTETVLLKTSVSIRYETPKGLSFEAAPFYNRMMLSAYQKDYPVQNKPYIYGINVGVNYTLGK